jgi:hypothetical protein
MKIDEKSLSKGISGYTQNPVSTHFTQIVYRMMIFFSHQFSPCGRAGGFHALRAALTAPLLLKARNSAALWLRL